MLKIIYKPKQRGTGLNSNGFYQGLFHKDCDAQKENQEWRELIIHETNVVFSKSAFAIIGDAIVICEEMEVEEINFKPKKVIQRKEPLNNGTQTLEEFEKGFNLDA